MNASTGSSQRVDFGRINRAAIAVSNVVVSALAPNGHKVGAEWVALNPVRPDKRAGSFKVNLQTGCWSDFATGDSGGDLVSLAAYIGGCGQREAAIRLAEALGVEPWEAAP
tara:strand:- start:1031 stop:1363 length:333 start_codon:yes stop_codon:yes gene_type:complete